MTTYAVTYMQPFSRASKGAEDYVVAEGLLTYEAALIFARHSDDWRDEWFPCAEDVGVPGMPEPIVAFYEPGVYECGSYAIHRIEDTRTVDGFEGEPA